MKSSFLRGIISKPSNTLHRHSTKSQKEDNIPKDYAEITAERTLFYGEIQK